MFKYALCIIGVFCFAAYTITKPVFDARVHELLLGFIKWNAASETTKPASAGFFFVITSRLSATFQRWPDYRALGTRKQATAQACFPE
jgi:hypothetical protein